MADSDVLVIGSGGSGLIAAVAAAKEGASVAVLSKTVAGTASCTAYSNGFFTLADEQSGFEQYVETTLKVGRGINRRDLVEALGRDSLASIRELQSWGITLRLLENGHATVRDSSAVPIASGSGFIAELRSLATGAGVRFLDNVRVTDILMANGRVRGVEYCDWKKGTLDRIACNAVVIATGGAGQIFKRTDNPTRITGDGYALALKAGLPLVDMEFVQFYPLGFDEPRFPCWMVRLPILDMARLTDGHGREFLKEKMREWHLATGQEISLYARDRSARVIREELAAGGEVLLHLEDIERQRWEEWDLRKVASCFPPGVAPADYGPVHVSPLEHYFCGGVAIDEDAATSIEGLFACGEVTGGVDGASRVGGNALSNVATFALKAGKAAAAAFRERVPQNMGKPGNGKLLYTEGDVEPSSLVEHIRVLNQEFLGLLRDEKGLKKALGELEEISGQVREMRVKTPRDLLSAFEVEGLLLTSRAVAQAALAREESRGVHYRADFPHENPDLERSRHVKLEQGAFVTGFAGENT